MRLTSAAQWALQLPPDVLQHPMPFPVRLEYAEKIVKRVQSEALVYAADLCVNRPFTGGGISDWDSADRDTQLLCAKAITEALKQIGAQTLSDSSTRLKDTIYLLREIETKKNEALRRVLEWCQTEDADEIDADYIKRILDL